MKKITRSETHGIVMLPIWVNAPIKIKHFAHKMTIIRSIWFRNCCANICINMPMCLAVIWFQATSSIAAMHMTKWHYAISMSKSYIQPAAKIKTAKNCTFLIRRITSKVCAFQCAETPAKPAKWRKISQMVIIPSASNTMSIVNCSVYHPKVCRLKKNSDFRHVAHVRFIERNPNRNVNCAMYVIVFEWKITNCETKSQRKCWFDLTAKSPWNTRFLQNIPIKQLHRRLIELRLFCWNNIFYAISSMLHEIYAINLYSNHVLSMETTLMKYLISFCALLFKESYHISRKWLSLWWSQVFWTFNSNEILL